MRTNLLFRYILLLTIISGTVHAQEKNKDTSITVTIDFNQQQKTIHNIGTSFCWYAEEIGKDSPLEKRKMIASLLFSKDMMPDGTPKGIGVSPFRFNIGAGSAEQGANSQITDPSPRVECFLAADGSYDWNKQKGYQWFLKSANQYKVENLIAFLNSPPVFFNKNGLARKSVKENSTNLKEDHYEAAADFIATVMKHFDEQNIHFVYLSPVNEPQWEWAETKQEGSPWNNREIADFAKAIDRSFTKNKVHTRILIPEAAKLDFLLSGKDKKQNQIDEFLNPQHPNYVGGLQHLAPVMAGHSYFTDNGNEQIVQTRKAAREKLQSYPPFSYWQSEYRFLGNGYKDGIDKPSAMDVALFLAKIIHTDLVVGNATAWQYWNAIEPTNNLERIPLFYLIAMNPNQSRTDGEFKAPK